MYNAADESVQFRATTLFSLQRRRCSIHNGRGVQPRRRIQISKNNDKHSTGEIPFCALTGGEDGGYENFHEFVDTEHTVEAMLAKQEERRLARRALEALSPVMRRRFLLHHAEKRTAKEIAKMEGVSEYSVKESLKLARKKLEAFWKKFD